MADAPRAFVCGYPIEHSRSPLIHEHWLRKLGLAGSYQRMAVLPGQLGEHFERVRSGELVGGNVTIPHKEEAFRLVDRHDAAAARIGAVNTVWMEGDVLVGGNTDAHGFAANLDEQVAGWDRNGPAIVLGAGGAARAVLHALIERKVADIRIANRSPARAEALAKDFDAKPTVIGWDDLDKATGDAGLLINTTSLGMKGEGQIPVDMTALRQDAILSDIVYVPLVTPFLARAREAGLRISDGLSMLLHQAAPGFARWFGQTPAVDAELRRLIEADIERAR